MGERQGKLAVSKSTEEVHMHKGNSITYSCKALSFHTQKKKKNNNMLLQSLLHFISTPSTQAGLKVSERENEMHKFIHQDRRTTEDGYGTKWDQLQPESFSYSTVSVY